MRIGYLSADFHLHATAALIAELFELRDTERFEVFGYSIGAHDEGPMRKRLVAALDHFHDLTDLSHDEAAARIRQDEIDILVDLKGYTFQARAEILARRPAPIQVNYLGYPSTMGARFIDYIIGDPLVTPFEHGPFYAETIVQLPHSYQPNDRKRFIAPDRPTRADCGPARRRLRVLLLQCQLQGHTRDLRYLDAPASRCPALGALALRGACVGLGELAPRRPTRGGSIRPVSSSPGSSACRSTSRA